MKSYTLSSIAVCLLTLPLAVKAQSASSAAAPLNDANIAAIVVTANTIDVDAGKMAEKKSKNPEVKEFAEMMIRDHESVNKQAVALVTKLNVTPEPNDLTRKLQSDASKTAEMLSAKKGKAFDLAYVNNEVAYHEAVISVVDTMLIPGASNAELKALLVQVRPVLQEHLEHAKHVQSELK